MSQPKRKTTSTGAKKTAEEPKTAAIPSPSQITPANNATKRADAMVNQTGQRIKEFAAKLSTTSRQAAAGQSNSTNQGADKNVRSNGLDTERAEQMLTSVEERIGRFAAKLAARTREEVEDIWAEAQSIHRKGQ